MQEDTIVVRRAGQAIPKAYFDKLMEDADVVCFGASSAKDGVVKTQRMVYDKETVLTWDDFDALQKSTKDTAAIYWFGHGDRPDDCIQPYQTLVNSKNETTLVLFIEGDCSSFYKQESALTDDYHAFTDHLKPLLLKEFKLADQSLDQLLSNLGDGITKRSIASAFIDNGVVTALCAGWDEPESFTKGSVGMPYGWGWVSRHYDYVETPPPAPSQTTATDGVVKRGARVLSSTTAPAPSTPPMPPNEGGNKEGTKMVSDVEAAIQHNKEEGRVETEHEMIGPPEDKFNEKTKTWDTTLKGKARQSWFRHNCTLLPADWYHAGAKAPAKVKSLTQLPKPKGEVVYTNEKVATPATGPKQPDKAVAALPADRLAKLKTHLETLDRNSNLMDVVDPKQAQALEAKHGDFFSKIGKAADYADYKVFEWFVALGDHDVQDLALLCFTLRNAKLVAEKDIDILTADKGDTSGTGTVVTPTEPTKPVDLERPVRRVVRI